MIELSVLVVSPLRFALGIANAGRIGASAKVLAANPINKSRFMKCSLLGRAIAMIVNPSPLELFHTGTRIRR
jgi:hypothetical protein